MRQREPRSRMVLCRIEIVFRVIKEQEPARCAMILKHAIEDMAEVIANETQLALMTYKKDRINGGPNESVMHNDTLGEISRLLLSALFHLPMCLGLLHRLTPYLAVPQYGGVSLHHPALYYG